MLAIHRYWSGRPVVKRTWPYDMWILGVVWLELLLATPHVFQISPRTAAVLQHRLHHSSQVKISCSFSVRSRLPPQEAPVMIAEKRKVFFHSVCLILSCVAMPCKPMLDRSCLTAGTRHFTRLCKSGDMYLRSSLLRKLLGPCRSEQDCAVACHVAMLLSPAVMVPVVIAL